MDPIQSFMDAEGAGMVTDLTSQGFTTEQADRFVPESLATLPPRFLRMRTDFTYCDCIAVRY